MMLFTKKNKYRLADSVFREETGTVHNPGRGWYRIYTFVPGGEAENLLPPVLYDDETIALVMIDISAYRETSITRDGLSLIRRILSAFEEAGVDMILRIVYDTQGRGIEREPTQFSRVIEHISQTGAVLREHADSILLFQGMFVGSWGEMHTSKFLSPKYLRQMTEHFLDVTEGLVRLAYRTPVLLRKIVAEGDRLCSAVGFFDDALLADATHLGTFGIQPKAEAGWAQMWTAEEEAEFLEKASYRVPFGGEALQGTEEMTAEEIIAQMERFHVSYLNCTHDMRCLEKWRGMYVRPDVTLYDYISSHLGYRFTAEKAEFRQKGKELGLTVTIANKGFACCPEALELVLYTGERECASAVLKPEELQGGGRKTLDFPLTEDSLPAGESLFICLRTKRKRMIRFANEGAGERLFLGKAVRGLDGQ